MLSTSEKTLLSQLKGDLIKRYGSVNAAAATLNVSRSGMRLALLGRWPGVLQKMVRAGLVEPQGHASVPATTTVAANAATAENIQVVVGAANARPVTGSEWELLSPWGNFPNQQGLQRVTPKEGQAMVSAFNSSASPVPIYIGHPDVDPAHYKDDRRIGKVEGLEVRADGLYCKPSWNDLGKKNVEQGYWVFASPVWTFKRCPGGFIEPTELVSVGLTNRPNIPGVKPWAKNSIVSATTPGAARREAKQQLKEHVVMTDGYSALTAIAQKQDQLRREKGMGEHEALLQAQVELPVSAAAAAAHMKNMDAVRKENDRREAVKDFTDAVHQRMSREKLSFHDAWMKEKAERKKQNQYTPYDD